MPRPCSHAYHKYSVTSEIPMSFKDGKVRWWINNTGKDFWMDELEEILTGVSTELNTHFEQYGLSFEQAKSRGEAFIQIYFTGYKEGFWANMATSLFPRFRKFFVIEPFIMDDETLAYAFGYGSGKHQGHCYINDKYDWKRGDYLLSKVLLHEILHIANVGHTDFIDDLMNPHYTNGSIITEDCEAAIHYLYSKLPPQN